MQRLYGLFGFQLFEEPLPAQYLADELEKRIPAPNKWMYQVYWLDGPSKRGLQHSFMTIYEFTDRKITDPEKAIRLFVDIYKEHFKRMSSIRILRPFLYEFPITPATCPLSINFYDSNGKFGKPPIIANVFANKKSLLCSQFTEERPGGNGFIDIFNKPLIELEDFKVLYERGMKRSKCDPSQKVPILKASKEHLFTWVNFFCTHHNLMPLAMGPVGDSVCSDRPFDFLLMGHQKLSLIEAHQLGASCFRECFNYVKEDKESLQFLKNRCSWGFRIYPSPTPVPEHIAFRISFWDENIDRPVQPYIAEIRYFDGVFKYYTADEVQKLVLVHEETFDEAMKFLDQLQQN